ncbi:hypothetical protein FRX31_029018 [Thalictrum thalictroides]|uniref:Uncharacterized protein n=1 Tax=Thalictrum thalictroides TaxID=46969 RepID=A0A7J6V9Q8_THATH|nr:hypothetical protein FRX31_029018 [Thalictrum thalictroides]
MDGNDIHTEDNMVGEEMSALKSKGRSLPSEQHYFRFERNRNMLSDEDHSLLEKDRHRIRERQRRENLSDEQRSSERERRRIRDEQRRKSMSDEQREREKERRRIRERERRNNMNDEQKALEMERRRIRERQHRQNMNDEQRSRDRERRRERDKQRRERMNDEQRAQERERRRLYEQQKRGKTTSDKLVARRKRRAQMSLTPYASLSDDTLKQGNEYASYSIDANDGDQLLALTQDILQVEIPNTSERSSITTVDVNEGIMVGDNGNHVLSNEKASYSTPDGNHDLALTQEDLRVEMTDTIELSSMTFLDFHESAEDMYNDHTTEGVHIGDETNEGEDNKQNVIDSKRSTTLEGKEAEVVASNAMDHSTENI